MENGTLVLRPKDDSIGKVKSNGSDTTHDDTLKDNVLGHNMAQQLRPHVPGTPSIRNGDQKGKRGASSPLTQQTPAKGKRINSPDKGENSEEDNNDEIKMVASDENDREGGGDDKEKFGYKDGDITLKTNYEEDEKGGKIEEWDTKQERQNDKEMEEGQNYENQNIEEIREEEQIREGEGNYNTAEQNEQENSEDGSTRSQGQGEYWGEIIRNAIKKANKPIEEKMDALCKLVNILTTKITNLEEAGLAERSAVGERKNNEINQKQTYSQITAGQIMGEKRTEKIEQQEKEAFDLARRVIGLYPIKMDDINKRKLDENSSLNMGEVFQQAGAETIRDFLKEELGMRWQDVDRLKIIGTFYSQKGPVTETLYVEFENEDDVRRIKKSAHNMHTNTGDYASEIVAYIPKILKPKYEDLKRQAYKIRHQEKPKATKIWIGKTFELRIKDYGDRTPWAKIAITKPEELRENEPTKRRKDDGYLAKDIREKPQVPQPLESARQNQQNETQPKALKAPLIPRENPVEPEYQQLGNPSVAKIRKQRKEVGIQTYNIYDQLTETDQE